jgi:hypothetical protein
MKFETIGKAVKSTGLTYLGSVNSSSKLLKNGKLSKQHTYGLYLSPASTSGYDVCSHSTPECRMGCLATSGHAAMDVISGKFIIQNCRINKTKLFHEDQEFFMQWLVSDIKAKKILAEKQGFGFSVRLNCTSDINWQNVRLNGLNIFEIFPDVQFYDYTKNPNKFMGKPENYHLTFSYTGKNWSLCKNLLSRGFNIAMVFNVRKETELPTRFAGFEVVNGDLTDYRVADSKGVIIGLKFKHIADKQAEHEVINSCFVVQSTDLRFNQINVQTNVSELV